MGELPPLNIGPTLAQWQSQRQRLRRTWLAFLGQGPQRAPLKARVLDEENLGEVSRSLVSYQTEDDCRVEAYLLCPRVSGPFPSAVVFHSTQADTIASPAGLAGEPAEHFGLALAQRGVITLSPRNFLWHYRDQSALNGDGCEDISARLFERWPEWTGMGKMLWDGMRAMDYLLTVPGVDRRRLGCIGHSLGAKETLYMTAFDERVGVGVSSEGGVGIPSSNWDAPWYLGKAIHDRPDLAHHQLLALCAPRALLIIGGGLLPSGRGAEVSEGADSVESGNCIEAARPAYGLCGKENRLRLFLHNQGHSVPLEARENIHAWLDRHLKTP